MNNNEQQSNYPLKPSLVTEKQSSISFGWFRGLAPQKKKWLGLGLIVVIIVVAVLAYLSFASPRDQYAFYFTEIGGEPNNPQELDDVIVYNGIKKEVNVYIKSASYVKEFKMYLTPSGGSIHDVDLTFTQNPNLSATIVNFTYPDDGKGGYFNIYSDLNHRDGIILLGTLGIENNNLNNGDSFRLEFTDTYDKNKIILSDDSEITMSNNLLATYPLSFTLQELGTGEMFISLEPSSGQFVLSSGGDLVKVMLDPKISNKEAVAVGGTIKYNHQYFEITPVDSTNFPLVGAETNANGVYQFIRGRQGDGQQDNYDKVEVLSLKIKGRASGVRGNIEILGPIAVLDDGQGTQINLIASGGSYEIVDTMPEILRITNQSYDCYDLGGGKYTLGVSWDTNLTADSKLELTWSDNTNKADPPTSNPTSDATYITNGHYLNIDTTNYNGFYEITSRTQSGLILKYKDSFDCKGVSADFVIRDLVVTPYYNGTADLIFLTSGGSDNGNATVDTANSDLTLTGGPGDFLPPFKSENTSVHRFKLSGLSENTKYTLEVKAHAKDFDNNDIWTTKTVSFITLKDVGDRQFNKVLKVNPDRICDSWLYCRSAMQVENQQGKQENLCFDIGLCNMSDEFGNCISAVSPGQMGVLGGNMTFESPYLAYHPVPPTSMTIIEKEQQAIIAENKFKNLSGLIKAGMVWDNATASFEGYQNYANMKIFGNEIHIPNGDFELSEVWPWVANDKAVITAVKDVFSAGNYILQVSLPPGTKLDTLRDKKLFSGAKIPLGNIGGGSDYVLTFDVRADGQSLDNIADNKKILVQLRVAGMYLSVDEIIVGPGFERVSRRINYNLPAGQAELIFNQVKPININETQAERDKQEKQFQQPFYLDNVSMLPLLQVQTQVQTQANEITESMFIPRECRMYPLNNAPACNFIDNQSGKYYAGWNGFCVEQDPGFKGMCLNWYPLDVLPGETDVFGSGNIAGYKDRKPLYYCLESGGDAPYYDKEISGEDHIWQSDNETYSEALWPVNFNVYKDEIIDVKIMGVQIDHNDLEFGSDECELSFYTEVNHDIYINSSKTCSEKNCKGAIVFDYKNKKGWEDNYTHRSFPRGGHETGEFNPYAYLRCWGIDNDTHDDTNLITAHLVFNDQELLQGIHIRFRDGSAGAGATKWDKIQITYQGERCNIITQVVDPFGTNYALSSKIDSGGWVVDNNIGYKYDQNFSPYGAVVPYGQYASDPGKWPLPLYVTPADKTFFQSPYQTRAGSPYALKMKAECSNSLAKGTQCTYDQECNRYYECLTSGICISGNIGNGCTGDDDCYKADYCSNGTCYYAGGLCDDAQECRDIPGQCDFSSSQNSYCSNDETKPCNDNTDCLQLGVCESPDASKIGGTYCLTGSKDKLNTKCTDNNSCGISSDGETGICMGIGLSQFTDEQKQALVGDYNQGIENLSPLFVKSLGIWYWDFKTSRYVQACSHNMSIDCGATPDPECVELSKKCWDKRDKLGEFPKVLNITVNGREGEDKNSSPTVFEYYGTAGIKLGFNAHLNQDQLPLTAYRVYWGDGKMTDVSNLKIAPRTDPRNQHVLLHTYVCADVMDDFIDNNKLCDASLTYNCFSKNSGDDYCVFKPSIQVQDNWEMCNGGDLNNICPANDRDKWKAYGGIIKVYP